MHSVRLQRGLKLTLFASISNGASTVNNVFPSNSSRVTLNLARLKQSTKYCLTSSFSHFSEKQTRYSPAAILPPRCHVFQCHVTSTHPLPTQIKDGKMEGLIFGILRYTLIMLENLSIILLASSSKQQLYAYYAGKVALSGRI